MLDEFAAPRTSRTCCSTTLLRVWMVGRKVTEGSFRHSAAAASSEENLWSFSRWFSRGPKTGTSSLSWFYFVAPGVAHVETGTTVLRTKCRGSRLLFSSKNMEITFRDSWMTKRMSRSSRKWAVWRKVCLCLVLDWVWCLVSNPNPKQSCKRVDRFIIRHLLCLDRQWMYVDLIVHIGAFGVVLLLSLYLPF